MNPQQKHLDQSLYKSWDRRWDTADDKQPITSIGHLMFKAKDRKVVEVIKNMEASTVIDVGCALGYTLETLQKLELDCVGIDVAQSAINACVKRNLPVRLQNIENVDEQFDIVFSDGMLEHFLDFEPYVSHFCRVSRRYVVIIQPNHSSFVGRTAVYFAELFRGEQNIFEYNYRISDFIDVFQKYDFGPIVNLPMFFDVFRLLVFEKDG